jgi:hypothetical protein
VLFGGGGIAVAACGEDEGENGECQELEFLHFKSFLFAQMCEERQRF